jgi:hypothetical protein
MRATRSAGFSPILPPRPPPGVLGAEAPTERSDSVLTRREFIWRSGQLTLLGVGALAACHPDAATLLEPGTGDPALGLANALVGGPHQLSITGPTSLLRFGESVTITGTLKDSRGKLLVNTVIGVSDGLGMRSSTTKTDKNGKIGYATIVSAKGAALVEFVVAGYRYPFVFQSRNSKSPYYASSALFSHVAVRNATKKTVTARVRDARGNIYQCSILKNTTQTVVTVKSSAPKRVTRYAGVTISAGIAQASATVDTNGIATITVTGGQLLLRGSIYGTTARDVGGCLSPGVDAALISGEVALCVGTDGVNISAGGSFLGATAGFNVDVY